MNLKQKKITVMLLSLLIAIIFFASGLTKLLAVEMQLNNLESWGYPLWLRFPIGFIEMILALGILIKRFKKKVCLALYIWGIVAIYTHVQAGQYDQILPAVLFMFIATIILILYKPNKMD